MKYSFNYSDCNYKDAINYYGTDYYNCPMTIDIDGRLFVLSMGTSDRKTVEIDETSEYVYIIGENAGLNYISLTVIDLSDNSVQSVYLSGSNLDDQDCYSYDVLNKETDQQIEILSQYL